MEPRLLYSADLAGALALATGFEAPAEQRTLTDSGEYASTANADAAAQATFATIPLGFESNAGQGAADADFLANGSGYGIELARGDARLTLLGAGGEQQVVTLTLAGARADPTGEGENLLAGRSNYIVGNDASRWLTGIANYGSVVYRGVYEGVDLRYYGTQRQLEYDFIVAPGASADAIRLQFQGVESASVDAEGQLVLRVAGSDADVRFKAPVSYQRGANGLEAVSSRYVLEADGTIGFALGAYDASRELVIDPVLDYATYFGGTGRQEARSVTTDEVGNVYVTGRTTSSNGSLAPVVGAGGGLGDIFVAKFSGDLSTLLYSTRIGGTGDDEGRGIAVDSAGNVAITGWTQSSDFPLANANDSSLAGTQDSVVLKLNASGGLVFSTYYGGNAGTDWGNAVAMDGSGNVYAAGQVSDRGIFSLLFGTSDNAFVNKYSATGTLVYEQTVGGTGVDEAFGIAVDGAGEAYVVGRTNSSGGLVGGLLTQVGFGGSTDGFLVRLDASGNGVYSTYIGGSDSDTARAVAIDGSGKAYVVGTTHAGAFTTTANAMLASTTANGRTIGYLRVYDTNVSGSSSLQYSSYIGGSADGDTPVGVAYAQGRVIVAGNAVSTDLALTPNAIQATNAGGSFFLLLVNPAGTGSADLQFGTYYADNSTAGGVAVWGSHAYVVGGTSKGGLATTDAYQPSKAGPTDAIVASIAVFPNAAPVLTGAAQPPAVLEDSIGGTGFRVSSLLTGRVTDADAPQRQGIAIVGADASAGSWQYSIDAGASWLNVGSTSLTSALLLGADSQTRLRFIPNPNYAGTIANALTIRAWDRTSGSANTRVDTSSYGGSTAFSSDTASIAMVVTAVNDPPVRLAGAVANLTVLEDAPATSLGLGALAYGAGGGADEAAQTFTFTVTAVPSAALGSIVLSDGTVVAANANYTLDQLRDMQFKAAADANGGPATFSWSVIDSGGGSDRIAESLTISVTAQNDPPVRSAGTVANLTVAEDGPLASLGLGTLDYGPGGAIDEAGQGLSYTVTAVPPSALGTIVLADGKTVVATGTYTLDELRGMQFKARADANGGPATFAWSVADSGDGSNTLGESLAITVTPVNDDPVTGTVDLGTFGEDAGALVITSAQLLAGASDVDSDALSVGNLSASGGALVDNRDGTWTFTPERDFNGSVTFAYEVSDGSVAVAGSATLAVSADNDAPVAGPVALPALAEDGVATVTEAQLLGGAADVDGDTLSVLDVGVSDGTLVDNGDGTWTFTPGRDFNGSVSFTYEVTDGAVTVAASATLEVTPVNDAPTTSAVTLPAVAEDDVATISSAQLLGKASDVDGDVLAIANLTASGGTLVDNGDGTWTFTPARDFNGPVSFAYEISDGGATVAGSATLEVTAVNDAPTTSVVTLPAVAEDGVATISSAQLLANASDVDGDALSLANVSASGGTLVDNGDGTWTFTPAPDSNGPVSFTYQVTDGAAMVAGSATLEVTPVNDAPTTSAVTLPAIAEDGTTTISSARLLANASDVDGDVLAIANLTASGGTLVDNGDGTWTFTPVRDFNGPVTFTYEISDGAATVAGSATLEVTPVNDAPTTSAVTLPAIAEDGATTISSAQLLAKASDVDADALAVVNLSASSGTLRDNGDGTWTFTPVRDFNGPVTFTYEISDGVATVAGSATLEVTAVNDAPTTSQVILPAVAEDGATTISSAQFLANASDVDGDVLAVRNLLASSGTLKDNGDGTWTFTAQRDLNGPVSFTYEVTDGAATVAGSAALSVTAVNDAPTTSTVTLPAIAEDGTTTITVAQLLANASDVDGDFLALANLTASGGTLVSNLDGTWTFTPTRDFNGPVSFTYEIGDGAATVAGTATLAVTPVNDAPITSAVTLPAVAEDGATTISSAQLLANASDVDGDVLSLANVTASSGTLVDNLDGTWTFTPTRDFNGPVSFTYEISDGGATVGGTATLAVTPVNDAPTTSQVILPAIAEDGATTISSAQLLANASDVDGDALAIANLTASGGTLVDNGDGTWIFTPVRDLNGPVTFTYEISDGAATVAGSATLEVTPVNDAPITSAVTLPAIEEDGATTISSAQLLANASDVDGNVLAIVNLTASSGTLKDNGDGTWTFTPGRDFTGPVSFTYQITDGAATVAGSATLELTPVNDAPTTSAVTLPAIAEDGATTISSAQLLANASDVDGDVLAIANLTASSGTLKDNEDGTWTFTPQRDSNGPVSFTYEVTDGAATVAGSAALSVTAVNDAPTTSIVTLPAIAEDGTTTISWAQLLANASDVDGDVLAIANLTASSGTLKDNGDGTWTFTPQRDLNGPVSFTYEVTDGTATVDGSAALSVRAVNDAPTTSIVTLPAIAEDGTTTITVAQFLANASDVDGDVLTLANLTASSGTLVNNLDGTWTFTPARDFNGPVNFRYEISDGAATVGGTATLAVTPVNDAPTTSEVILPAVAEDGGTTISSAQLLANASDVDGDVLAVRNLLASSGTLKDNGDGTWTFTPARDFNGPVSFTYEITDGAVTVASTATLAVTPVNDAPTTSQVILPAVAEDGATTISSAQLLANASDVDGDVLAVTNLLASSGTLKDNGDGTWTFTPGRDFTGPVSFTYEISDGAAAVGGTATLAVTPVNDAPTTSEAILPAVAEDGGTTISSAQLLANASDVDGDVLAVRNLLASSGTLKDNGDGTWTFTPGRDFNGPVSFTYQITDSAATVAASATLAVTPVNDAPTTSAVSLPAIAEDGTTTISSAQLLANASDVDGDVLALANLTASSGTLVNNLDGTWTFTPARDFNGPVSFTYEITDGAVTVASTATLAVTPVNDAPTTSQVILPAVAEDGGTTISSAQLLANASDVDADALALANLTASGGTLVDNGNGTWTFTPARDFNGRVSFSYQITDGAATVAGSATLEVTPVNDTPTTSAVTLPGIAEDGASTISASQLLANAWDVDGDVLTLASVTASRGTLVDNGNGTWTFTPARDFNGPVTFTYEISDGAATVAGSATLEVTAVNDAPTTSAVTLPSIAEDGAATIAATQLLTNASDVDGDVLAVRNLLASSGTLVDNGNGTWTFTPQRDFNAAVTFTYEISDGAATVTGSAALSVTPVNDAPTASAVTLPTVAEDGVTTIAVAQLLANASDVDGDVLTFANVTASSGTLVDNGNGTWTFTPARDFNGPVTFTYEISDGAATVAGSATLEVTAVNDAPTTSAVTLPAMAEDGTTTINSAQLLANASDVDGDVLALANLTASSGTLVNNLDGTWTFTPTRDFNGSVSFTYVISDGGATVAGTATLAVTSVNDAPTTSQVILPAVAEDSGTTISSAQLLANASDVDGEALALANLTVSGGTLVDNGNGTWTFTPADDFNGPVSFTYEISDGAATAAGSASLEVTPVNDAPTTSAVTLPAIAEDGATTISSAQLLANASDVDGDVLSLANVSASGGTLVDNGDGTWTFTPARDFNGPVTFTYEISDGAATVAGSATLEVTPVNDAPTTSTVTLPAIAEDGTTTITVAQLLANASDVDGDFLALANLTASGGTLVSNLDGTWTFTPTRDFNGPVSFTYEISDGSATVAGTATLAVRPVNDPPITSAVTLSAIAEDGATTISSAQLLANASDVDGDVLSLANVTASSGTLVDNLDGTWTFTPTRDFNGPVSFTYEISDGAVTVASTATLAVTPVNDAPSTSQVILPAVAEDGGTTISFAQLLANASDVDGDVLAVRNLLASSGTLKDNGDGTWTFTPGRDFNGPVSFTYQITDGAATVAGSAMLSVTPVNDAPTASAVTLPAIAEDGASTISASQLLANASDVDGDVLAVTHLTASSGTLVDNGNGTWTFIPGRDFNGPVSFTYEVTDGAMTVAASATLVVTPVNDAPTASAVNLPAVAEDGVTTISSAQLLSNASDVDGGDLAARNLSASSGTLVDNGNGTWTFTPGRDFNGPVNFTYEISDGGATVAGSATLEVTPVNDAPATSAVTRPAVAEDGVATIAATQLLANASDVDGDVLALANLTASSGTLVDNGNGSWTFTPARDFNGPVSFTYEVTDGAATVAGSATLEVTPVNDAPTTSAVTLPAIAEDGAATISSTQLLANASDVDGDVLALANLTASSGMLVDNLDGTWTFTPTRDFNGPVSFTYQITDGAATVAAGATLAVTSVNDAPTASVVTLPAVAEDGVATIAVAQLLANASDVDGDVLALANLTTSSGTLVNNLDGTWTFTPTRDFNGPVSFTYEISDGGATVAGSATLEVTPVNDAPTTSAVTLPSIAEDGATTIAATQLLANAVDVDGDVLAVRNLVASSGTVVDNGNGTWTFTPGRDFNGPVSFTYQVTDGATTVSGSAALAVTPVDDAPTTSRVILPAVAEDGGTTISSAQLLANASDVDGDVLALANLNASSGTLVDYGNGTWTFTPARDFNGRVSFSYQITDGAATVAGSATLEVTPVNDAPTTSAVTLPGIAEDGASTISASQLLANASDADGDVITLANVTASRGTLVDNGNGTWTFTPARDFNGPVTFTYEISDGAATVAGSATVEVTPVNDAPTTSAVTLPAIAEDGATTITVAQLLANASDVDHDVLAIANFAASSGTLVNNFDGTWTFTPTRDFNGPVSFTYEISDGGATVAGGATLVVGPVNDAPTTGQATLPAIAEDGATTISSAQLLANALDVDGDVLAIANLTASGGTLVDNGDGTWTFYPTRDFNGSVSFTYEISDGAAAVAGSGTVEVTPVNDAPITSTVTLPAIAEDGGTTITVAQLLANASDVEDDVLVIANLTASSGTAANNGDGTWTFTPARDFNGLVSFTYEISDGATTVAGSATLEAAPVNDAPTTSAVTLPVVAEDGATTISSAQLLAKASDVDGDLLALSNLTASSGTLKDNEDGTWTFTPTRDFSGSVSFTYEISDGAAPVAGSAALTVTPVNDAPTAGQVTLPAIAEDGATTISSAQLLVSASDVDDDVLAIANLTASSGTLVDNRDGTWTFTPGRDFNGPVSFTYEITDGAATVGASATLAVTSVNDAPMAGVVTLPAIAEDGVATVTLAQFLANASDVDGDDLTLANLTASSGTLKNNGDGTWTFTPRRDFNGLVSFTYQITDGAANVAASATLTVTPVNDAPTTSEVNLPAIAEDGATTIAATQLLANASDVDGDVLTVTNLTAPSGTLVDNGNGTWTFTPTRDFNGPVSFTYEISDGGAAVAGSATLEVAPVNDAPTTSAVTLPAIAEDGATTLSSAQLLANASDVDGDVLAIANLTASGGTLKDNGDGTWTFTPTRDFNGPVSFTYEISDGAATVAASATLEVTAVNDAPTTSTVTLPAIAEEGATTISSAQLLANASDVDADALTLSNLSASSGTLVNNGDGTWTYTPSRDFNGPVSFTYEITDGAATVAGSATLEVTPVNDAPTTSTVTLPAIAEDGATTISSAQLLANASDADADRLSITNLSASSGTLVDNGNGTWTFTPTRDFHGPVSFTYEITDGAATVAGSATLAVAAVNDAPTTSTVTLPSIAEDGVTTITPTELLAKASDVDGDRLRITNLSASAGTLVDNGNGTWTFTPAGDFYGQVSFTYEITDGAALGAGRASLTVTPVNDAPTTSAVSLPAIPEDSGTITITADQLLANAQDADGDVLAVTGLSASGGTVVDLGDGKWSFTPAPDFNGRIIFSYGLDDGSTWTAASATLDVAPRNDAPVAGADTLAATEDTTITYRAQDLLANDRDVEGTPLRIATVTSGAGGTAVLGGNGYVTFTPDPDFNGEASFTYTVTDGDSESRSATVTVVVAPVNDAPVFKGEASLELVVPEGQMAATTLLASDVDGPLPLRFAIAGGADAAHFVIDPVTGRLSFADARDFEAPADADADNVYHVVVQVSDGMLSTTQTLSIRVADMADTVTAPTLPEAPPAGKPEPSAPPPAAPAPATPAPQGSSSAPAPEEHAVPTGVGDEVVGGTAGSADPLGGFVTTSLSGVQLQSLLVESGDVGAHNLRAVVLDHSGIELISVDLQAEGGSGTFTVAARLESRQLEELQRTLRSTAFAENMDRLRDEVRDSAGLEQSVTVSVAGVSLGLSLVYVLWLVRGGVLMGSYLSAMPAWRILDPLPVLARPDDEHDDDEEDLGDPGREARNVLRGFE
ncbi:cadherin-like domain-containing protein [Ramlibacter alkalitolerans]|uniref:Cadherin-like domain-containing protein n=2 Tax=Ramlibacter alkalitolerans TaxID=2039631 RepID=A0ABS1JUC9_9BURK|nr:cadherin-like domain-containing protein [Ramlibacter alkalitolerans]